MNSPAGDCLFAFEANSGVNRISTGEFTETIPDVYPVIYSLNPLSMGTMTSERSLGFFRASLTSDFSVYPQE